MRPIKRILAPTDFSPYSEHAARYAVDLAERLGAELTFVHVYSVPMPVPFPDGAAYIPSAEVMAALAANAVQALEAFTARIDTRDVPAHRQTVEGQPKIMIPHLAAADGYDLIVMGTHGRTGLRHLVLGSVAEAVVRSASCPVVTVPLGAFESAVTEPPLL
jgi:nucleotide-binding universal stress UspA family protein